MYGRNSYDQGADGTKWIVFFFLIVLTVAVAAIVLATGTFSPRTAAEARQIDATTNHQQAINDIDVKYYAKNQEAKLANDQALNNQKLDQAERDFQQNAALKDWTARGLGIGVVIAMDILACAGAFFVSARAWAAISNAQAERQVARKAAVDDARHGVLSKAVGEMNTCLRDLQKDQPRIETQLEELIVQQTQDRTLLEEHKNESIRKREELARTQEQVEQLTTQLTQIQVQLKATQREFKQMTIQLAASTQVLTESHLGGNGSGKNNGS